MSVHSLYIAFDISTNCPYFFHTLEITESRNMHLFVADTDLVTEHINIGATYNLSLLCIF